MRSFRAYGTDRGTLDIQISAFWLSIVTTLAFPSRLIAICPTFSGVAFSVPYSMNSDTVVKVAIS